jgi:hypothetical protein
MNTRRFVCALLGLWIGASLFMAAVAAFNFKTVDHLLASPQPEVAMYIKALGPEKVRSLFRHEAAEFNRALFEGWGIVQLGISLLVFGILLFGTKEGKFVLSVSLLLVLITAGMHLLVTPNIVAYGRALDFMASDKEVSLRERVRVFHNTYSSLEGVKLVGIGIILAMFLREIRRRPGRGPLSEIEEFEAA